MNRESNIFVIDEVLLGAAAVAAMGALRRRGRPIKKLDGKDALRHLDRAIDMHRRHLTGEEPTTDASQERLMKEMIEARYAIAKDVDANRDRRKKSRRSNPESNTRIHALARRLAEAGR